MTQVLKLSVPLEAHGEVLQELALRRPTVQEVRAIYERSQAIDDMTSVNANDLEVTKDTDGKIVVSYSYERDIPLYGPAYLVFRFNDSVK